MNNQTRREFTPPYTLEVSYNAGISYGPFLVTDDLVAIKEKAQELDDKWLRWVVTDSKGQRVPLFCAIHRHIFEDILGEKLEEASNDIPK